MTTSSLCCVTARDRLTAQELQIAQLAAEGLSNREIGERLFLSHRTVGGYLYRISPNLDAPVGRNCATLSIESIDSSEGAPTRATIVPGRSSHERQTGHCARPRRVGGRIELCLSYAAAWRRNK